MHLSKFGKFEEGVPAIRIDGNNYETRNPHLHFETNNVGLNGKCSSILYFKSKIESELSAENKKFQLVYKNKVWK